MSPDKLSKLKPHPLAALLPAMRIGEYAALAVDIAEHGVHEPITLFEGMVLDGRHRVKAAVERRRPAEVKTFDGDEAAARAFVLSMNVHRRHLSTEQRRALIKVELQADPAQSDRAVAEKVKASDKTVASVRAKLESSAEIPHLKARTGKDGKVQAAAKAKPMFSDARYAAPFEPPDPWASGTVVGQHVVCSVTPVGDPSKGVREVTFTEVESAPAAASAAIAKAKARIPSAEAKEAWLQAASVFGAALRAAMAAGINPHFVVKTLADEAGWSGRTYGSA